MSHALCARTARCPEQHTGCQILLLVCVRTVSSKLAARQVRRRLNKLPLGVSHQLPSRVRPRHSSRAAMRIQSVGRVQLSLLRVCGQKNKPHHEACYTFRSFAA